MGGRRLPDVSLTPPYYVSDSLEVYVLEMISVGALFIAVEDSKAIREAVSELHPSLRTRVTLAGHTHETQTQLARLVVPIYDWLQTAGPNDHLGNLENLGQFYREYHSFMSDFILGVEHGLQIHLELDHLRFVLDIFRNYMKTSEVQVIVANVQGVLSYYESLKLPALGMKSTAPPEIRSLFRDFLNDPSYHRQARARYLLGIPRHVNRARSALESLTRTLASSSRWAGITDLFLKAASLAIKVPFPGVGVMSSLFAPKYFPPIVNLSEAARKAEDDYYRIYDDLLRNWHEKRARE